MYVYQWINETKDDDKSFIRAYGITEEGDNVCVRVRGFKRFVFVELPAKSAQKAVADIAKAKGACSTELCMRHHLYYMSAKKFPFLKCNFITLKQLNNFVVSLRFPIFIPGTGRHTVKVHEELATPVLQLISSQNLRMAGWLRFKGKRQDAADQVTHCSGEYVVDYTDLVDMPEVKQVVIPKVLSFDLEVNSQNINCMPCDKPGDKIFQISCVFNDGRSILLTLPSCDPLDGVVIETYNSERELIVGFIDLIKREKPNCMTGYNILSFDIQYLIKRCYRYFLLTDLKLAGFNVEKAATLVKTSWSSSAFKNQHFEYIDWEGILLMDLFPIIMRDYKMDNYKLNTVATKFVGAEKDPLTPKDLFAAYRKGQLTEVGKYCVKDSALVLQIFDKLQIWVAFAEMAKVCNVNMFTLYTHGQQIKVYSQVYKYCHDNLIVVDTDGYVAEANERYRGAFVIEPSPGYYEDVVPLDFSSLYPSIMQAWNICFSSAVRDESVPDDMCNIFEWDDHVGCDHDPKMIKQKELKDKIEAIVEKQRELRKKRDAIRTEPNDRKRVHVDTIDIDAYRNAKAIAYKTVRDYDSLIKHAIDVSDVDGAEILMAKQDVAKTHFDNISKSSFTRQITALGHAGSRVKREKAQLNKQIDELQILAKPLREEREELMKGKPDKPMCVHRRYRFYRPEVQKGVIPIIITNLLQARHAVKEKMKQTEDQDEKIVYDKQQLAYKVSANSMYGTLGAQRGMLVYMPGAMCVTMKGREAIQTAEKLLREKYNAQIVYGDTDSNYVRFPWITDSRELWDHAIKVAADISSAYPSPMKLEFEEKIYRKFLILSKKRYMWQACDRDGVLDEKVGKKGVVLARRDNSKFIRSVYEKMTEMIFHRCTKDDIITWLTEKLDDLFRGTLELEEYVITKSVGDVSGDYDQETSKLGSYKVRSLADDPTKREQQLKGKSEREFYVSSCPPQVRLAERMKARGFPVEPGTRIEYVVLHRTGAKSQGDKIEELQYFKDHKNILRIDPIYYLESLQKPLDQLFKAGLDEPFMSALAKYRLDYYKTVQQLKNKFMPRIVETI